MNTRFLFTHMPPGRLFLITAGPGAVGMLASLLFYMVDGIFIGRYIGETAFAALNLALPFVIINFSLSDLIASVPPCLSPLSLAKKRTTPPTIFLPAPACLPF